MRPRFRSIIPFATSWQTKMVLSRLRSITARTSTSLMKTQSLGLGLPPAAAMSPPALWTRMSMGPRARSASATTRATSSVRVRSPRMRTVFTPCALPISSAVAVSVVPSPNSAGPFSRMPWTAMDAPIFARVSAKARPRPRPAPVTSATWPFRGKSVIGAQAGFRMWIARLATMSFTLAA